MSERENGWYWHTDDSGGSTLCRWVASSGRLVIGRFDSRMGGFSYRDDQLTPVARPAEVAALRAEVERLRGALRPLVAVIPDICNALDLDPDETSIRVRVDGGARDGEVLAERTLADMLTSARAALEPTR